MSDSVKLTDDDLIARVRALPSDMSASLDAAFQEVLAQHAKDCYGCREEARNSECAGEGVIIATFFKLRGEIEAQLAERLAETRAEIEPARALIARDAAFQEWAQSYLPSWKWAGHDRADAIKQELLERDAQLAETRAKVERVERLLSEECCLSFEPDGGDFSTCGNCGVDDWQHKVAVALDGPAPAHADTERTK